MGQFLDDAPQPRGKFLDDEPAANTAPISAPPAEKAPSWYQANVAGPLTRVVSGLVQGRFSDPSSYPAAMKDVAADMARDTKAKADAGAEFVVPQTETQALATVGTAGAGALSRAATPGMAMLWRILGGTGGGAVGGAVEDPSLKGALKGAAEGGVTTAVGEGIGAVLGAAGKYGMGAKARQAEDKARGLRSVLEAAAPPMRRTVTAAERNLRPMKGGRTAAALEEVALGSGGKNTLGDIMETGMLDATLAAGGQRVASPRLLQAWHSLPGDLPTTGPLPMSLSVEQQLKRDLAPDPNGQFTISQAERLLAILGDAAYGAGDHPLKRSIAGLPLREAYEQAIPETLAGMGPAAASVFAPARDQFKGGNWLMELLRVPGHRTGAPNRIMLNEPAVQKWVSENREAGRRALGGNFAALEDVLYNGGQMGTRSILTPGTGETSAAFRQVFGRGQGGAPQMIGGALRTALPNLGYQPTGRGRTPAPGFQTLFDILFQRGGGKLRDEVEKRLE